MEFGGYTLTGPREANEDSYFMQDISDLTSLSGGISSFVMVSDGMGGYQGGDVASALAVEAAQSYLGHLRAMAQDNQIELDARAALLEIVQNAHEAIKAVSQERGGKNMGATFVGAFVSPDHAWIAHVGDSRAYRIRNGEAQQITQDHSQVGRMLSQGLITEEEAQVHPSRNRIDRALGFSDAQADLNEIDLAGGDALLLCSDGVYTVLQAGMLQECVCDAADAVEAAERVTNRAIEMATDDNSTAVVVTGFRPKATASRAGDTIFATDPGIPEVSNASKARPARTRTPLPKTLKGDEGVEPVMDRRTRPVRQTAAKRPTARRAQGTRVLAPPPKRRSLVPLITVLAILAVVIAILVVFFLVPIGGMKTANAAENPATNNAVAGQSDIAMSLVFDVSGSMEEPSALKGKSKLASAKKQAVDFISSVKTAGNAETGGATAQVGVVSFSDTARLECNLSTDYSTITQSITSMATLDMTNIYDGLEMGIDQLNASGSASKILVFLSDGANNIGHSNDEIKDLARQAADAGITIYAIGYGSSSELDEELLRYMADVTGGQYSHEDSANINAAAVGIFSMMKRAEVLASNQEILSESMGTVAQGQNEQIQDVQVTSNGTMIAYLYWPGSKLTLRVVDPSGVEVNSAYPGCVIDESTIPSKIEISNAAEGTWKMSVYGDDVSMDREPFYALTAFKQGSVAAVGGGGGSGDNTAAIMFIFLAVAIGAILFVYATSKRQTS